MKNLILILTVFACSINLNAQLTFSENFLGNDYLAYKGVKITLKENAISGFMYVFYSDLSYCQSLYDNNVIYPEEKSRFNTSKDSLVGRVFLVKDIIDKTGSPILKISYSTKPLFVLEDTLSKQIIYFKYDGKYNHKFPFLTSKIEINKEVVCSKITRVVDEMTDETTLRTPLLSDVSIQKIITSKGTFYYLSLRTKGSTVVVDGTGVIILFADGTKMTKSVKIDVDAGSNGFDYSAFISLTQKDLGILSAKQIKKFRLYIYDQNVKPFEAEEFTYFVKCMMEMK